MSSGTVETLSAAIRRVWAVGAIPEALSDRRCIIPLRCHKGWENASQHRKRPQTIQAERAAVQQVWAQDRWSVKSRIKTNFLEGHIEMHQRELWHLYKLRSKTVHGEIDPSDGCLGHAVTRIRLIGSQMYRAILGANHYPYREGRSREMRLESFSITTYYPTIQYPGS